MTSWQFFICHLTVVNIYTCVRVCAKKMQSSALLFLPYLIIFYQL